MILRPATFADEQLLLEWRNDPTVLAMSLHPTASTPREHTRWLAKMVAQVEGSVLLIAEDRANGTPIGQGRIERAWKAISRKMDTGMIGYSIASEYRGKGYGKELARLLAEHAREIGYSTVGCRIKRSNTRSLSVAVQAGVDMVEFC